MHVQDAHMMKEIAFWSQIHILPKARSSDFVTKSIRLSGEMKRRRRWDRSDVGISKLDVDISNKVWRRLSSTRARRRPMQQGWETRRNKRRKLIGEVSHLCWKGRSVMFVSFVSLHTSLDGLCGGSCFICNSGLSMAPLAPDLPHRPVLAWSLGPIVPVMPCPKSIHWLSCGHSPSETG